MADYNRLLKTVAYAPKASAFLSLMGSGYIVFDCTRKLRIQARSTYPKPISTFYRLMIGISVGDIMFSTAAFVGTWAVPRGSPHVWGAAGSLGTCALSGVFAQAGITAIEYNVCLSLYYLFHVGWNWPSTRIRSIERYMHAICLVSYAVSVSVCLSLGLYNDHGFLCQINEKPHGCKESWKYGDDADCERGDNATLYLLAFGMVPYFLSAFSIATIMIVLYCTVRQKEARTARFSASRMPSNRAGGAAQSLSTGRGVSRRLANQAYCYVGALFVCFMPAMSAHLKGIITNTNPRYEAIVAMGISLPLQGLLNVLVYLRPRYLEARRGRQQSAVVQRRPVIQAISQAVIEGDLDEEGNKQGHESKTETSNKARVSVDQPQAFPADGDHHGEKTLDAAEKQEQEDVIHTTALKKDEITCPREGHSSETFRDEE